MGGEEPIMAEIKAAAGKMPLCHQFMNIINVLYEMNTESAIKICGQLLLGKYRHLQIDT